MKLPSVRGSIVLSQIAHLRALPDEEQARALQNVPSVVLKELAELGRLEWTPIDTWMELSQPMMRNVGEAAYRKFWRKVQADMTEQPVFKSIVQTGIRMFGLSPSSFCKLVPTAQSLSFRNAGDFSVETVNARQSRIHWKKVPPEVLRYTPMSVGFCGAFSSFFELCKTEGTVSPRMTADSITFDLAWA